MATVLTPEETAQKLLAIFVTDFELRPGNVLPLESIIDVGNRWGPHDADFKPGLDYAEEQGWIEISDSGNSVRLTETGFAQARDRN